MMKQSSSPRGAAGPPPQYVIVPARPSTSRALAVELESLADGPIFSRTLGWTRDDRSGEKFISGLPEDRYRKAVLLAGKLFNEMAAKTKTTYSTLILAQGGISDVLAKLKPLGRCFLWCHSSKGQASAKIGASRWYNAHNQIQCLRLTEGFKIRGEGVVHAAVGFCWDDELQAERDAKVALRAEGFLPECHSEAEASETTEPESADAEDFPGGNRGRGCPLCTAPQGYKHQAFAFASPAVTAVEKIVIWFAENLSVANVPVGSMVHGFAL